MFQSHDFKARVTPLAIVLVLTVAMFPCGVRAEEPKIPDGYKLIDDMILPEDFGSPERGTHYANLWPNGVVPYAFDPAVTQLNRDRSVDAMAEWEAVALVDFIPRTTESNYIYIRNSTGNSSSVGMVGGGQNLNMVSWSFKFIIAHELGHALGLLHEQQRTDRDTYVQINTASIDPTKLGNFTTAASSSFVGPYDFESVMHYGECAFTDCPCPSTCTAITVLPPNQALQSEIGQRNRLSNGDAETMAFLYGARKDCNNNGTIDSQDISSSASPDCNDNGVPDECDVLFQASSGRMFPMDSSTSQSLVVVSPPVADGDVSLRFQAFADLASTGERLDIDINGALIGSVFSSGAGDCSNPADIEDLIVPAGVFNALVAGGDATITATATSSVNPGVCDGSYAIIDLSYASTEIDCNFSGVPDDCEGDLVIATDPVDALVCEGSVASFDVTAVNPGSASYQWLRNGVPLTDGGDVSGATTQTLNIQNADVGDEDVYACEITDGCLAIDTADANLVIRTPLSVSVPGPALVQKCAEEVALLQVDAGGTDLAYQWHRDGVPLADGANISGSSTNVLSVSNLSLGDEASSPGYTCEVSDFCGDVMVSSPIALELVGATIGAQPQSGCALEGGSTVFSASVQPPPGLTLFLQWYKDGAPLAASGGITGVFTDTLSIDPVSASDAGDYTLRVVTLGANCILFSEVATLQVGDCGCATPGDLDADADYDLVDIQAFQSCFGADVQSQPECDCANVDDSNSIVDLSDWEMLAVLLVGP